MPSFPSGSERSPASLAGRPLFEPVAALLRGFEQLPGADALNALARQVALATGSGQALAFMPPVEDGLGYEQRIALCGKVEHRPDNWHDFFNALAWLAFPRAKAALSDRHGQALAEQGGQSGRGPLRDALTQFDECGVAVLCADPELAALLQHHAWKEAFWQRRADLMARVRFLVFGHALFDHLRAPFFGLCGKAVYLEVESGWLARDAAWQRADVDARLAAWLATGLATPRDLKPLPLLGIPGVVAESEVEAWYDDVRQFRPLRGSSRAA